jgi:hypothetical protein
MRFKTIVVLFSILFSLVATNAYSILDGGSGLSADQLIDESNGIFSYDSSIPENPQEARKLWNEVDGINFTKSSDVSSKSTSPEKSRDSTKDGEGVQFQTASSISTVQTVSSQEIRVPPPITVAGNWSFRLRDSKTRILALALFQSNDTVFGKGIMNDGGDTEDVSASGTFEADKMNLEVISAGTITLYKLAVSVNGNSASGEYKAFSSREEPWIGIAEGMHILDKN